MKLFIHAEERNPVYEPQSVGRGDSEWLSVDITEEEYQEWLRVKQEWEAWQIKWAQVLRGF